ncbi:hypothetical protein HXX76_006689 [Chlamydomonas incerta]|uniref:Uncharacterized protein n=1 Tax=Chlamydomonas incerta TaxID=51695 RepID=A0A835T3I7_CHLIN|nr:hypothetical protein HXX76_006689 [Chlamydomonas incerta]|eukprot:KAG2436382.1 hypothetical protein HXX76_006689 [Chlamydomonas incerta]
MYFCRLQFFVFMLLRGPAAEPSHLSLTTAFKLNAVFDLMMFISTLGCKPPSIAAELAVGTFQTAATGVLHCWHAHRTALAPPLYQLLLVRLAVMAVNVYTGMALGGGRVRGAGTSGAGTEAASGSRAGAGTAGASGRPGRKCEVIHDNRGPAELGPCDCAGGGGPVAASPIKGSPAAGTAAAASAAGNPSAGLPAPEAPGAAAAQAALRLHAPAAAAAAAAGTGAAAAAIEAAVAPIYGLMPNRPYRSILRRHVMTCKVPWAEPEDIQPGFQQRLAELVAAKGLVLADISVRRDGGDARRQLDGGLDVAALVRTLGLLRGQQGAGGDGHAAPGAHEAELLAAVQRVRDVVLTRGAAPAHGVGSEAGAGAPAAPPLPRIVDVWPRALHVPALVRQAGGGEAPAAGGAAAVTLRVRVEWPSTAQGPAGGAPSLSTVLVQAGGVLLPLHIAASRLVAPAGAVAGGGDAVGAAGQGGAPVLVAEYEVELEALPPRPGSMLLELRGPAAQVADHQVAAAAAAAAAQRMLAPLLAVADAAVAQELSANMADWPSDAESQLELDELVFDLGTWADAAAVAAAGAWGRGAEWNHLFGCAPLVAADEVVWSQLLPHLISYCRAAGWTATAGAVEADHAAYAELQGRGAGQQAAGALAAAAPVAVADDAGAVDSVAAAAAADDAGAGADAAAGSAAAGAAAAAAPTDLPDELQAAALRKSAEFLDDETHTDLLLSSASLTASILDSSQTGLAPRHRRQTQAVWWHALLQVLGFSQRETRAEAAAFRAFVCSWTTSLANIAQATELLMVVALLSRGARAGQAALGGELAIVLSGCGLGAAAALAWALLPAARWRALALRLRVPRQLGYLVSKSLLGLGLARPPAGALAYAAGPGMLLMEGAILPGACLVSPAAAMAIACIKLPLNVLCALRLGIAGGSLAAALIIAVRTEVLGLLTNTAFHAYLRLRYQEQAAVVAAAVVPAPVPAPARERGAAPRSPLGGGSAGGGQGGAADLQAAVGTAGGARGTGLVQRTAAQARRD